MDKRIVGGALALLLAGCGGGDESDAQRLDCAWVAQPDNCWVEAREQIRSCAPADGTTGTFAQDRKSCSYADGASVRFDQPVPMPYPEDGAPWHFELKTAAGERCVRVDAGEDGDLSLEGAFGKLSIETGFGSMRLTCPDGSKWETDPTDPLALLSCEGTSFSDLPGYGEVTFEDFASFFLNADEAVGLFECSLPNP